MKSVAADKGSSQKSQRNNPGKICAFALAFLCLLSAACQRERAAHLSPAQVRQITQELARAAAEAPGTTVRIRRGRASSGASQTMDQIRVALRSGTGEVEMRQRLEGVATSHALTVDTETKTANATELILRSHGRVTHRIEIERRAVASNTAPTAAPNTASGARRLAILLDDLGSDMAAANAIFALHEPLTISVLPYHTHSQEIAQAARQHGCEVMLHLPMQSVRKESPEEQELRPGLSGEQVRALVEKMLDAVPEADGVNNHQGSQATANAALMRELMPVLKDEGVFYVDSRTTADTVAYDTAREQGVKAAFRNVPFLDDVQDKKAVMRQLRTALQGAKQKGEAIAIGHPHTATLEALREMLPQAKRDGVQLVLVSELVK